MANTYTQLYVQLVFAVYKRHSFIKTVWQNNLYKYITAVMQNDGHKMLAINGMPDHIHIFFGLNPNVSISELVKDVKRASNNWLNDKMHFEKFAWQGGYGAFTYSRSQLSSVCNYINKQQEHHAKHSFKAEYLALLKAFEVDFKDEYLFEFYDNESYL